jgi:hypothetical protein
MKNNVLLLSVFLLSVSFVTAQSFNLEIKNAVDELAARLNAPIEVNISPVTIEGTDTPTGLTQYLGRKINEFAVNNSKSLFKIVQPTRGIAPVRTSGGPQKGKITGTYAKQGNSVEVTLSLIDEASNVTIGTKSFLIPLNELQALDIAIFPANDTGEKEVIERERILSPLKAPARSGAPAANINTLNIDAWPNSDTHTYYDGEALIITLLSNKNCYIKVYHIDVDGKQQMIFPNQIDRENYLRANTELQIPKGSRFVLGPPYGQETIIAVASGSQFENLDKEMITVVEATRGTIDSIINTRGLSVQDGRAQNASGGETANTRFTFTILASGTENKVLRYSKPDDMRGFMRDMRTEILGRGGQFNGNEREGSFSETGLQGSYRVSGNSIIFTLKEERNKNTQPSTRGIGAKRGYNFSFDRPGDLRKAVNLVKSGIAEQGGAFRGDERAGSFEASGITGEYNIAQKVDVTIIDKPFIIPNSMIEKEVKKFFGAN